MGRCKDPENKSNKLQTVGGVGEEDSQDVSSLICILKCRDAFVKAGVSAGRVCLAQLVGFAFQGIWTGGVQYPGLYLCLSHRQIA